MVPEQRDAILARAEDYAHSRELCGVHYPSDEAASRIIAYAMMGAISNHPRFRKELDAARAETRAVLGLPSATATVRSNSDSNIFSQREK
jgi:acid phosphatase (class A)